MAGKMLVKLLLLLMLSELMLVSISEAWWGARRRCSSHSPAGIKWVNSWHNDFTFKCRRDSTSLRIWRSQHRNCKEDRIHYFKCGYGPVNHKTNCAWTQHVNKLDLPMVFQCPHDGFITGVTSSFSNHHNDRRFGFRCCHLHGFRPYNCKITREQNNWDQELHYKVPRNYYLVGVFSRHDDSKEDRLWQFEICQFSKCK